METWNVKFADDGIFHITIQDYVKYFTNTQVCKHVEGYHYNSSRQVYESAQIYNFFKVKIDEVGKTFFLVNLKNSRLYTNQRKSLFLNRFCSVLLFKTYQKKDSKDEGYDYISSTCGRYNRLHIEVDVTEPGQYMLAISYPIKNDEYIMQGGENMTYNNGTKSLSKLLFSLGLYSKQKNVKFEGYNFTKKESTELLRHSLFKYAFNQKDYKNFALEDEKDSWRTCYLPENKGAIGFLIYQNQSQGYIYEKLNITHLQNINIISIIDQTQNMATSGLDEDCLLDSDIEIKREDFLQSRGQLESRISMLNKIDKSKEIYKDEHIDNSLNVQITIGPKSDVVIVFEKYEETAGIKFKSDIVFSYPIKEILSDYQFIPKIMKIRYQGKPIDVLESLYEHTTGVIFKYQNNTKNMRVAIFMRFNNLDNLEIKGVSSVDKKGNVLTNPYKEKAFDDDALQLKIVDEEIKDVKTQAILEVFPGESKILELTNKNKYKLYAFSTDFIYYVCVSKGLSLAKQTLD